MLALYRSDRQAEALEAYRQARRTLVEELGLEPGPRLQELERAMLSQDRGLEPPAPPATARGRVAARWREQGTAGQQERAANARAHARRSWRRPRLAAIAAAVLSALAAAAILATRAARTSTNQTLQVLPSDSVAVIDPRTNAVVAAVRLGGTPAGIAVGEGAVWVGNSRDQTLARIDPETRKVVTRIGLGVKPWRITVAAGAVWVASDEANALLRIDPLYNQVTERIDLSRADLGVRGGALQPPADVAAGGGAVWVAHALGGHIRCTTSDCDSDVVSRVSTSARAVVRHIRADSVFGIAFGDGAVWTLSGPGRLGPNGALSRIDPQTNSVVWANPLPAAGRLAAPNGSRSAQAQCG